MKEIKEQCYKCPNFKIVESFDCLEDETRSVPYCTKHKEVLTEENTMATDEKKEHEFSLGTVYQLNKDVVKQLPKLSKRQVREYIDKVVIPYVKETDNKYYMLLCHEQRDYTIFNLLYEDSYLNIDADIEDCLFNRGDVKSIEKNENNAIEIWLDIDGECFAYYFFPYNEGVIEVEIGAWS